MSLQLSPFLKFLQYFKLTNDERLIRGIAIEQEVERQKVKLENEIYLEYEGGKKGFGAEKIKWIDGTLKSLAHRKNYEKNLLRDLKAHIKEKCGIPDDDLDLPKIIKVFKSGKYEQMFIDGLQEMNVVDEAFQAKRGFQAVSNAFFKSSVKDKMFKTNLRISEFIEFLNENFDASIRAKDRLSDPDNYILKVEKFIKDYSS